MNRRIILAMFAFLFIAPVGILSAEEIKEEAGQTVVAPSETAAHGEERGRHDAMRKEEKGHNHDNGHGMMMGHHSKGWAIVIGVVMVVMMAAMVL